jgi:hypothetical protein
MINWKELGKKRSWPISNQYSGSLLGELKKTTKVLGIFGFLAEIRTGTYRTHIRSLPLEPAFLT